MTTTADTATDKVVANDNLFGVCAAIGEDFGFDPLYLRIAFAVSLLFNLELVLLTYVGLGAIVVASRLIFPNRKPAPVEAAPREAPVAIEEPEYRKAA